MTLFKFCFQIFKDGATREEGPSAPAELFQPDPDQGRHRRQRGRIRQGRCLRGRQVWHRKNYNFVT